jgi:spore coat polysaccharide biosynthesis protein SpsF
MKVVAIIQARMSASRLPGKVLLDIQGKPMLQWGVERVQRADSIDQVVVATTDDPSDNPVAEFCQSQGFAISRGSVQDVLDRYYQAAQNVQASVVVRITADCPLIDPQLIDQAVITLTSSLTDPGPQTAAPLDFIANRLPRPWWRTYPIGLDTEVFTFAALERAWMEARKPHQREHVTPFFYEDVPAEELHFSANPVSLATAQSPRGFMVALLHHVEELGHQRWTVDTPEDLELIRQIATLLPDDEFTWRDVLELVEKYPELSQINAQIEHKTHLDVDKRA